MAHCTHTHTHTHTHTCTLFTQFYDDVYMEATKCGTVLSMALPLPPMDRITTCTARVFIRYASQVRVCVCVRVCERRLSRMNRVSVGHVNVIHQLVDLGVCEGMCVCLCVCARVCSMCTGGGGALRHECGVWVCVCVRARVPMHHACMCVRACVCHTHVHEKMRHLHFAVCEVHFGLAVHQLSNTHAHTHTHTFTRSHKHTCAHKHAAHLFQLYQYTLLRV